MRSVQRRSVRAAWRSGIENLLAEAERVAAQNPLEPTGGDHARLTHPALDSNETLDGGAASGGGLDDCAGNSEAVHAPT